MSKERVKYKFAVWLCTALMVSMVDVHANGIEDHRALVQRYFPEMTEIGTLTGQPPAAEVKQNGNLLGYVYYTDDVVKIPAYSGKPIRTLVGFDLQGKIRGVNIVHHEEPILVVGITDADLQRFINQYIGKSVFDKIKIGGRSSEGVKSIDTISGATITVMVLNASITRAIQTILETRKITAAAPRPAVSPLHDVEPTQQPVWIYVWKERIFQIVILCSGLFLLLLILIFQDWLTQRPVLFNRLRTGFLIWTVLYIG